MGQNQNNTGKFASIFGKRRIAQSQPVSMIMDSNAPVAPVKKKVPIIPVIIVVVVIAIIAIIIVTVLGNIKKEQNEKVFNATQDYIAALYNDFSATDYQAFMQENSDMVDNGQNWLIYKLLSDDIDENIEKKRLLATKVDTIFKQVSSVYDEYSYKNDKTDEVIKQNSELKDIMILYLAAGKNDDELKSYYSDKEIDTDIKTIQENFDNSTAIVKTYYSTLLNYREIQKDYLKILTAYGCLKPSGIDTVCVEYMPKDNNYGKVKAQYNVSLARVKEQGSNIANAVINAARLLSGIGL